MKTLPFRLPTSAQTTLFVQFYCEQLSSTPNSSELDGKHGISVVQTDSRFKRKINPVDQPAMAAGKNEQINRKPERDSNPVKNICNYNVTDKPQEGRNCGKTENINHQPMGQKHNQSRYGMQSEEARQTEDQREETQQAPSASKGWRNQMAGVLCSLILGFVLFLKGGEAMKGTNIQWADDTCNPLMGCPGCEMFPSASKVLREVDRVLSRLLPKWQKGGARLCYRLLIEAAYAEIRVKVLGHSCAVTTTNIYHTTPWFAEELSKVYGAEVGAELEKTIKRLIKCYAAKLHLNRGACITKPDRKANPGYAATFEMMRSYEGRALKAAKSSDLLGQDRPTSPWSNGLPRMIFVGDMGDTFAKAADFEFLAADFIPAITSELGRRHIWQVLTKRPRQLAAFARRYGAFPDHVICMTTVTSGETLHRIDDLRRVECHMRGLSVEPLWERLTPESLNLEGIDWLIVGGESGGKEHSKPFQLEWARELRDICREAGVAFFLKQLGSNAVESGQPLKLSHAHGGDWQEWPEDLRVREFPQGFHNYRRLANAA